MKSREITNRFRLSEWARLVQERNESGEKLYDFLLRKGISKDKYYYWLRKLRKAAGDQLFEETQNNGTEVALRGFTEVKISEPIVATSIADKNQIHIEAGLCRVTVGIECPAETLVALVRELKQP